MLKTIRRTTMAVIAVVAVTVTAAGI